jgi:hypothetical protein
MWLILCIFYILFKISIMQARNFLEARASRFTRSVCETFAFATSETVSINSGNRLIQAVANVRYLIPYLIGFDDHDA